LRYWLAYNGFLDKITARKPEMKGYSVVVLGEAEIEKVGELAEKSVGFLRTDLQATKARIKLEEAVSEEKDATVEIDFYDDVYTMYEVLKNNLTDAIVLETDRIEILKEEVENFEDTTRIIYTFEVEIEEEAAEVSEKEITTEPFVVYISGSDSRTGIKTTARSDVNIIAAVNPKEGKILLVSIPRDTYVQLHDTMGLKDKLTHAGIYGINMSKTTIEDFLNIKIDYTIKVSFETVVKVVDEIDGIDIVSDKAMTLKSNGEVCEFIEGKQHVNGNCALRFARERKSYTTGDRHRGENQQQVITSIIGKLSSSKDYLLKIPTILDIAADSFETTFTRENISAFIRMQLLNSIKWNVESIAVDGTGTYAPTYSMGANRPLYVMMPSEASVLNATTKINEYLAINEEEPEE
ncbi:LCP family protein, partial [Candidatus Saccharibacteria bacterium]|nr:LCP family protein [Candidatus Saccharibacteria bacterium]